MRSDWAEVQTIGELLAREGGSIKTGPFGTALKASEYADVGVPLISVREIGHGTFHIDRKTPRICNATLARLPEYILQEGDIVFARKGGIERCALIRKPQSGWFLGSDGIRLRPPTACDARFIAYSLQTNAVKDWLVQNSTGSTMASLNQATIGRLPIALPAIWEQKRIADVLEAFDDRIALLREINATLEAIAQALFKSWFVDFDPVHARARGEHPAGMAPEVAPLFPDSFEESALGLVPNGWRWRTMDDVSTVGIGKTPPRKEPQWFSENLDDVPWVSIKDMGTAGVFINKTSEFLTPASIDRFNVRVVPDNTVLLSFKLTVGRLSITDGEMVTNEEIAHFKLGEDSPLSSAYIYLALRQFNFESLSSTSSIAEAVNSKTVRAIPILVPSPSLVAMFNDHANPIFERIKLLEKQAQTLANLRDTLLPRLISGQLRLPEGDAMLQDAGI
ncbi:TPA: restriction endonuclease subunit S [Aeromonas hydrophila]|uniref:restriction endonuclease subunit S n=1 Tax=Aeromonas hydrophila TaxID=644 RepID=UPI001A2A2BEE|nr:restriction endonuclease subunit S [Aeromonas hydrophila]HAT2383138.1 restriction endonuclease subunit S [Aeromonas hydrophila]HAT2415475.1 restriction endonuclease subunit S [Aeromonas hydrophila]HAT2526468.1 restriction endonuclease subunit S [Aeromonas hydrophila]HAT2546439.1 restriction endonuclease subunit S [Aeromonas hydrophila]